MYTSLLVFLWFLIAFPAIFFLLVLAGATYGAYSLRRSIRIASLTRCPKCGNPLGREAVRDAKERSARKVAELRMQKPGVRLRLLAIWEITCSNCAAIVCFCPQSNTIASESST